MAQKLITAPAAEPLTAAEVKLHCRIDDATEDSLLTMYIAAARLAVEHRTSRKLMLQTWEMALDAFPENEIELPFTPVSSIVSITYFDSAGASQVVNSANYTLDDYQLKHYILLAQNQSWPTALDAANAVKIRFVVGYANAASVPETIKQWMLLAIGLWYRNREAGNELGITELPRDFACGLLDSVWIPSL